jgi:type II secretory pathway component PulC
MTSAILAIFLASDLAHLTAQWPRSLSPVAASGAAPVVSVLGKGSRDDPHAIQQAHLFGQADPAATEIGNPPPRLRLFGVISLKGGGGYALLGAGGESKLYRQGAELSPGLTIFSILKDRVVLQRGGTIETLILPHFASDPASRPRVALARASPTGYEPGEVEGSSAPRAVPGALARTLNLRPAIEGGQRIGMRIMATPQGNRALAALGLNAGDVITNVAGADGDGSSTSLWELMSKINEGDGTTLDIERGGRHLQVTIDPAQANEAAEIYRSTAPN